ncbi:MAG TPA: DUF484 family protein [Burkholderiaceae bacterium]|nr:DUF484 family protein [Burkholderiaceae bacterium]HMX11137.1 DUF484 family protein [Burkholderiaceae bacterium]HMY99572.1 DUF484 family protein [Burkholderiaceae bacterium]HNB44276.1 DUF484 family protein [Burkholderiaceae bacterium]HNG80188.1 DUF484 family protein [Burkholderiaceae bacterium]
MTVIQGITEDEIANYLANTPGFFERHAQLLASVELANPHGQRAVSLQQRQMEMLRERIRGLERRIMDMIRHGQENAALSDRLHQWTRSLMLVDDAADLPDLMLLDLQEQFLIPEAALRLWGVAPAFAALPAAAAVSEEVRSFASSLTQPYCGANASFEAVQWLQSPQSIASLALIPLRRSLSAPAFGLLVLGSPDPTRYAADMGTEFLTRVGELASAAAARLLPPAD